MVVHLHSKAVDAAINVDVAPFSGLISHRLAQEDMVIVACPALLHTKSIQGAQDVPGHLLLHVMMCSEAWRDWCLPMASEWAAH